MYRARVPFRFPLTVVRDSLLALALLSAGCASKKSATTDDSAAPSAAHPVPIPGCESVPDAGTLSPVDTAPPPMARVTDAESLFALQIQPNLDVCKACHVPVLFSDNKNEDYQNFKDDWSAYGKGVDDNLLLTKNKNQAADKHGGGARWPEGSAMYTNVKILLSCWNDPSTCTSQLSGAQNTASLAEHPLTGDLEQTGGRNYAAVWCEDKPDCATLPQDPRELISGDSIDNPNYGVYFNDPFEVCVNDTLLATQARQNELLDQQGSTAPRYTAKPRPKTCGEWRAAVKAGLEYITTTPFSGEILTVASIININTFLKNPTPTDIASANVALADLSQQRYGWPVASYRNPGPFPGEDPNETNGGSLQLPTALAQVKDEQGKWTGKLGLTCFTCHSGQIGGGEVIGNHGKVDWQRMTAGGADNGLFLGLNGANTDASLALFDTDSANGRTGPDAINAVIANPAYLAGRTRGVNAADQEIVAVLTGRDFDTLDFLADSYKPLNGGKDVQPLLAIVDSGGDQDIPSWWWTHNKSRYLWTGFGSNGSVRGNYFAATANPHDGHWSKHREEHFQDMDQWLNTVEAPKFVGPAIDTALAERGAVVFHTKDLWADPDNGDIPRPGGNGSCAGCHGAYSPRFIHEPGFLPDTRLGGMTGYTVPLEIVKSDPADSHFFNNPGGPLFPASERKNPSSLGNLLWMSYPEANAGYVAPEERKNKTDPPNPNKTPDPNRVCGLGTMGGYVAQSLHGVWASAPYFHNGSIPTVWDVLNPTGRPNVWRRQQIPESEAKHGFRGYDTRIDRAYDYEKLGWKYEVVTCDESASAPYDLTCEKGKDDWAPPGPHAVDDRTLYNTNAFSKGNQGHEYTKVLTDDERRALIEYLKTL